VALVPASDGVVRIRPSTPADTETLIAGRDEEFHRWLGTGAEEPAPVGVLEVEGRGIVGWVDDDTDHEWLGDGEVNLGYHTFAEHRRRGYARRGVELLLGHLASDTTHRTATLLIDPGNEASLAVAATTGFAPAGSVDGRRWFKRTIRCGGSGP
jgi:RimJ/RimL family protein N-acetyltransferase